MDLGKLYEKYNILTDAKVTKVSEHTEDYDDAIEATKGGEKEKKLSTQIISKFFKHFPTLQTKALNAILDLCEDENSSIRICAIKALPLMCKDSREHLSKIVYVLAQLLQLEDQEYNTASGALKMIFKENAQDVVKSLFLFIQNCNEMQLREKCLSFIVKTLLTTQAADGNSNEIEDLIIEESKKLLKLATTEEFFIIMPFLTASKYGKSITGANQLLEMIGEQLEMDQDFDPTEQENLARLVSCIKFALPLFSPKCESNKFVTYICDRVLPQFGALKTLGDPMFQLQVLRHLAALSINCGQLDNPSSHVVNIFSLLKDYMPSPSESEEDELPDLDFSSVECLLFAFHRLARQCPDFLTHDPEVLKDFRSRLLLFSRGVQGCKKVLVTTISKKVTIQKKDQEKMRIAPCLLENIKALIKDLFYQPPVYKVNVTLSFLNKTIAAAAAVTTPEAAKSPAANIPLKRHIPITFDDDHKGSKQFRPVRGENMKLYQPPSGKFSNNFHLYDRNGRGRGGFRGRGRGRGHWRN